MQKHHLVSPTPFRDFQLRNPNNKAEVETLKLININSELVQVEQSQTNTIMRNYFSEIELPEVSYRARHWLENPDKVHIWVMSSPSVQDAANKLMYLSGQRDGSGPIQITENQIFFDMESEIFDEKSQGFTLLHIALAYQYSLQTPENMTISLRQGFEWLGKELEYSNIKVTYNKPRNSITIKEKLISKSPLKTSNPAIENLINLKSTYPTLSQHEEVILLSRHLIRKNLANPEFCLEELAKNLSLSNRTLQRKFLEHGTSFSALKDLERAEILQENIGKGLKKDELGELLGFSDSGGLYKYLSRNQ